MGPTGGECPGIPSPALFPNSSPSSPACHPASHQSRAVLSCRLPPQPSTPRVSEALLGFLPSSLSTGSSFWFWKPASLGGSRGAPAALRTFPESRQSCGGRGRAWTADPGDLGEMLLPCVLRTRAPTSSSSLSRETPGAVAHCPPAQMRPHELWPPLPTQAHPRVSRPAQICSEVAGMSDLGPPDQCPHLPHPGPRAGDPGTGLAEPCSPQGGSCGRKQPVHIPVPTPTMALGAWSPPQPGLQTGHPQLSDQPSSTQGGRGAATSMPGPLPPAPSSGDDGPGCG